MTNPYYYLGENHTVDIVIVAPSEKKEVLMIVRSEKSPACPGLMAIPGGFVDTEAKRGELWKPGLETHKEAALRELKEEANIEIKDIDEKRFYEVGTYVGNNRDPRDNKESWSCSMAFCYLLNESEYQNIKDNVLGMDDASAALWVPMAELHNTKLAFDHNKILKDVDDVINKHDMTKKKKSIKKI